MKVKIGEKTLIGKTKHGALVYGTVIWIHPKKRFLLTERTTALGRTIRECAMMGNRRGQLVNQVVSGWEDE